MVGCRREVKTSMNISGGVTSTVGITLELEPSFQNHGRNMVQIRQAISTRHFRIAV